jgi:AraC-like DNA-binding protein
MNIGLTTRPSESSLHSWLKALSKSDTHVMIDNAVHDLQGTQWRHEGMKYPGHINWLVLSGGIRGIIGGKNMRILPGAWLCLSPYTPLFFRTLHPHQRVGLLRFRLHVSQPNGDLPLPGGGFLLPNAHGLAPLAARLISDSSSIDRYADDRRRGILAAMYGEAFRRLSEPSSMHARRLEDSQIANLEEFISKMARKTISPQQLARRLNMKPDTFSRAFKRTFDQSPRQWLAYRRIRHAADQLLMKDATASQVAEEYGYADVFHFCRLFRSVMGCGTRDWRRHHGL